MVHAIVKAWSSLRKGLVFTQPKMLEELLQQLLFWNPRIRSEDDMMVGEKKYLPFARMLEYNVSSVRVWEVFRMKMREG